MLSYVPVYRLILLHIAELQADRLGADIALVAPSHWYFADLK